MQIIYEKFTGKERPVSAQMQFASNRMLREVIANRPKTESARQEMAEKMKREGFTEAAKYWQEQ